MFGKEDSGPHSGGFLDATVRANMPDADDATIRIVTAIAGLLGAVAYADREFSDDEQTMVRGELERVNGLTAQAVNAICVGLKRHIVEISTIYGPRFTRDLKAHGDHDLRMQVLELLMKAAAADGEVSTEETVVMRRTAQALGLSQSEYNAVQARYTERLAVLKTK